MFEIKIYTSNIKLLINQDKLFLEKQFTILPLIKIKDVFIQQIENYILLRSNNLINLKLQKKIINNLLLGLIQGFKVKLSLIGIGYKYLIQNNKLYFKLNKSHLIYFQIPKNIQIYQIPGNILFLTSSSLHELTEFIKKLKNIVKPNSYKKKGLFFSHENIILKKKK